MILSIDVGNTGIAFGFYKEKSIVHHSKVSSRPYKSKDGIRYCPSKTGRRYLCQY
jgi:pantothenate kinase type III